MSQFHYGSIKTMKANIFLRETKGLNSTMVRLKLIKAMSALNETNPSQFHYGSIKTKCQAKYEIRINKSQFHYGSIKTFF